MPIRTELPFALEGCFGFLHNLPGLLQLPRQIKNQELSMSPCYTRSQPKPSIAIPSFTHCYAISLCSIKRQKLLISPCRGQPKPGIAVVSFTCTAISLICAEPNFFFLQVISFRVRISITGCFTFLFTASPTTCLPWSFTQPHKKKSSLCCRRWSFFSAKLGIKTTGAASCRQGRKAMQPSAWMQQYVQSKRNPLLGNKIMYLAYAFNSFSNKQSAAFSDDAS